MLFAFLLLVPLLQQARPASAAPEKDAPRESPSEEFLRIGRELYAGDSAPYGAEPSRTLERLLRKKLLPPERRLSTTSELGREWIEQGKVSEAIALLEEALAEAEREEPDGSSSQPSAQPPSKLLVRLHRDLGQAYLRLAENQNCVERHAAACCILPLAEGGKHSLREPAEKARAHYRWLFGHVPDDLASRWLLNLLALLLGDYPDGVPAEELLPMNALATPGEAPLFRDVGPRAGVAALNLAGGVAAEDFDGDGWIDLLTSTCDPLGPLLYYRNQGDGTFEDRSESAGTLAQTGGLNLIAADFDNDGDKDAFVLRGAWLLEHGDIRNSLLRNEGGERFTDVTRAAGVAEPACPTQTGVFADFDGDGWLDLYVGNESRAEMDAKDSCPAQLFRNQGDGTFRDVAAAAGVRNDRFAKGVTVGDYDEDGDLDLYVSNIGKNRLYRNDGGARFEDVAAAAGVEEPVGRSFATWFFDFDEDGRLDLWVGAYSTNIQDLAAEALGRPHEIALPCLYHNQSDGTFHDVAREMGLARAMLTMGANFGDIDNDGWLDFYLGTGDPGLTSLMPNLMFRNAGGKRFEDVTARTGLGHLQKGHGVAFADFDGDGDQDLFHQLGGFVPSDKFQNALFENESSEKGSTNHWLALDLEGTRTNRDAIGARIVVSLETPTGPRMLHRAVGSVSSFGGSPHRQEIGLGDALAITRLEIVWPRSPEPQVLTGVPLDARLLVREGTDGFEREQYRRLPR